MISIVITAYKEPRTIGKAIASFQNQDISEKYELVVIAPDDETLDEAKRCKIRAIKDPGKGKPAALNIIFKEAKGDILVLSDGDVYVGDNSVDALVRHFKDEKVGAVTGRPISLDKKRNMMGYWSHLLAHAAHIARVRRKGKYIDCSGYLYAIRNVVENIPEGAIDDGYVSQVIWKKGYKIIYEPRAVVYVKFPSNFKDWVLQKKRNAGCNNQLKYYIKNPEKMRSFRQESVNGLLIALGYPKKIKEVIWTIELFMARLYLWFLIFIDINIKRKSLKTLWKRVESTK